MERIAVIRGYSRLFAYKKIICLLGRRKTLTQFPLLPPVEFRIHHFHHFPPFSTIFRGSKKFRDQATFSVRFVLHALSAPSSTLDFGLSLPVATDH